MTFPAGTFRPDPHRASTRTMLRAQAIIEAKLFLRHGEQLLLSFIIPVCMLVAITLLPVIEQDDPMRVGFPIVLAVAAMSSGFTGEAISLAFDRRYGALKRTGASGVPAGIIIVGKILGLVAVAIIQIIVLTTIALLLGWSPTPEGIRRAGVPHRHYRVHFAGHAHGRHTVVGARPRVCEPHMGAAGRRGQLPAGEPRHVPPDPHRGAVRRPGQWLAG